MAYPTEIANLVSVNPTDTLAAAGHSSRHNELKAAFQAIRTYLNVTSKGDLLVASGSEALARVGVGSDGQVLQANSGAAQGVSWVNAPGRNRIINGGFDVWQRGTSFSTPSGVYTADRWVVTGAEAGSVISQQAFAPGNAISGYEPTYYLRFVKGGTTANLMYLSQKIEDVRTFAGQTITISYWMKASTTLTNEPLIQQNFGSGGSAEVYTTTATHSVSTSWTRYSVTIAVPSISGKTLGAGSFLSIWPIRYLGTSNVTIEIWGVQVEAGSVATAFEVKPYADTLLACHRYYWLIAIYDSGSTIGTAVYVESNQARVNINLPVKMRATPSLVATTGTQYYGIYRSAVDYITSPTVANNSSSNAVSITWAASGTIATAGMAFLNNAASYLALSAEL